MAYAPIDDQLNVNAKILGLTHEEFRLWVAGLAWTYKHNRKGHHFIPAHMALSLAGMHRIKNPAKAIAGLVAKRGWDESEGGYVPHDIDEHDHRDKRSEAGRTAANARWSGNANADANASESQCERIAQGDAEPMHHAWSPVPVPVPVPHAASGAKAPEARGARGGADSPGWQFAVEWRDALPAGSYRTPADFGTVVTDAEEALAAGVEPVHLHEAVRRLGAANRTRSLSVELAAMQREALAANPYAAVDAANADVAVEPWA